MIDVEDFYRGVYSSIGIKQESLVDLSATGVEISNLVLEKSHLGKNNL